MIINEQEGSEKCPVNSFKHYIDNLNPKCNAFFQHPNERKDGYDNKPVGKNTIGDFMKTISKNAELSKIYTNHCIRKTTATAMHCQGFDLKQIANVTKHKNLQSLENYIGGPSHDEKQEYSNKLFEYASEPVKNAIKHKSNEENEAPSPKEIATDNNRVVCFEPKDNKLVPQNSNLVQNTTNNQLKSAENFFSSATFHHCTINIQMTK